MTATKVQGYFVCLSRPIPAEDLLHWPQAVPRQWSQAYQPHIQAFFAQNGINQHASCPERFIWEDLTQSMPTLQYYGHFRVIPLVGRLKIFDKIQILWSTNTYTVSGRDKLDHFQKMILDENIIYVDVLAFLVRTLGISFTKFKYVITFADSQYSSE